MAQGRNSKKRAHPKLCGQSRHHLHIHLCQLHLPLSPTHHLPQDSVQRVAGPTPPAKGVEPLTPMAMRDAMQTEQLPKSAVL